MIIIIYAHQLLSSKKIKSSICSVRNQMQVVQVRNIFSFDLQ